MSKFKKIFKENLPLLKAKSSSDFAEAVDNFATTTLRFLVDGASSDGDDDEENACIVRQALQITCEKVVYFIEQAQNGLSQNETNSHRKNVADAIGLSLQQFVRLTTACRSASLDYIFDTSERIAEAPEALRMTEQIIDLLVLTIYPLLHNIRQEQEQQEERLRQLKSKPAAVGYSPENDGSEMKAVSVFSSEHRFLTSHVIGMLSSAFIPRFGKKSEAFGNLIATSAISHVLLDLLNNDNNNEDESLKENDDDDENSNLDRILQLLWELANSGHRGKMLLSSPEFTAAFASILGDTNNTNSKRYKKDVQSVLMIYAHILNKSASFENEFAIRKQLACGRELLLRSLLTAFEIQLWPVTPSQEQVDDFVLILWKLFEVERPDQNPGDPANIDDESDFAAENEIRKLNFEVKTCFVEMCSKEFPNFFPRLLKICQQNVHVPKSKPGLDTKLICSIWQVCASAENHLGRVAIINEENVFCFVNHLIFLRVTGYVSPFFDENIPNRIAHLLEINNGSCIGKYFATWIIYDRLGDQIMQVTSKADYYNWFEEVKIILDYIRITARFYNDSWSSSSSSAKNSSCAENILPVLLLPLAVATDTDVARFTSTSRGTWQQFFDTAGKTLLTVLCENSCNDSKMATSDSSLANVLEFFGARSCSSLLQTNTTDEEYHDTPNDKKFENIAAIDVLIASCKQAQTVGAERHFLQLMGQICELYEAHFDEFRSKNNNDQTIASPGLVFGSPAMVECICKSLSRNNNEQEISDSPSDLPCFSSAAFAIAQIIRVYPSSLTTIHQKTQSNSDLFYDEFEPLHFVSKHETLGLLFAALAKERSNLNNNNNKNIIDAVTAIELGVGAIRTLVQFARPRSTLIIRAVESMNANNTTDQKLLLDPLIELLKDDRFRSLHSCVQAAIDEIVDKVEQECDSSIGQEDELKKDFLKPMLPFISNKKMKTN